VASDGTINSVRALLDAAAQAGQLISPGFDELDWMEAVASVSDDAELARWLTWAFEDRDLSAQLRSQLFEVLLKLGPDAR
jgi:hypothetical protein